MRGNDDEGRTPAVCAVIVTYRPDAEATARLVRALAKQTDSLVVVDNGSSEPELTAVAQACREVAGELIRLGENTGIAHAQNVGVLRARQLGATHVLLSDQDSMPAPGMVRELLTALSGADALSDEAVLSGAADGPVGAVGPYIRDEKPGGDELVYVDRTWGPRRAATGELARPIVPAAFLLASGCLIPMRVLEEVGPMNEAYFIDHVDLEWCLRARRRGYRLLVATGARLNHSLGDATVKLPGRPQPVHLHGPIRCYYLARNTIFLLRSGLLNWHWRVGYVVWLAKFTAFHSLLADRRRERIGMLARGFRDAAFRRGGRLGA